MNKITLSEEQIIFLEDNLGITKESLETVTEKEWAIIREKCFYIECDEVDMERDTCSERGEIAAGIADVRYSGLFS